MNPSRPCIVRRRHGLRALGALPVLLLGAALPLGAGCGGSAAHAVDATPPDATSGFGEGLVWNSLALDPNSRDAFHAFSFFVNPQLANGVSSGMNIVLMDIRDLSAGNAGGQKFEPAGVNIGFYGGTPVPGRDGGMEPLFDGNARFHVSAMSLNMDGTPRLLFPSATLGDNMKPGFLDGKIPATLPIPLPAGAGLGGSLSINDPEISGTLIANSAMTEITGLQGGVLQGVLLEHDLAQIPNPGGMNCSGKSLLDLLALGGNCTFGGLTVHVDKVAPTDDVDGDGGIDSFADTNGDGVIDLCTPGAAGATPIAGDCNSPTTCCAEDPRMGDGYRIVFDFTAVRAILLHP